MPTIITKRGQDRSSFKLEVRQRGHVMPRRPVIDLSGPGRLRTAHVLALVGVAHSTMYKRLKAADGSFPTPDGKDGGLLYWDTSTVRDFLASGASRQIGAEKKI